MDDLMVMVSQFFMSFLFKHTNQRGDSHPLIEIIADHQK